MVRQSALQVRFWQMFLRLNVECPSGVVLLFINYNHVHSITGNIQLVCILLCFYWLLRSEILKFFQNLNNFSVLLEL